MGPAPFASTALAGREQEALALLTIDRASLSAELSGADLQRMIWAPLPLLSRPFITLRDGQHALTSPRSLIGWLGDGAYHRLLGASRNRDRLNEFTAVFGELVEAYVLEPLRFALPGSRPPGGGRVFGEVPYSNGRKLSPDAVIDLGPDLIVVEVVSTRVHLPARATGDTAALGSDLERILFQKLRQLTDRIGDLLGGAVGGLDIDPAVIGRVWPVLVTVDGLPQQPPLWEAIHREVGSCLGAARLRPLTLLDLGDVERLAGSVHGGYPILRLLARKTDAAFAERDLTTWLRSDPLAPTETSCAYVQTRGRKAMARSFGILFPHRAAEADSLLQAS